MANVRKILEIIYGANPTSKDLQAIIDDISERLPEPIVEQTTVPTDEPASTDEPAVKSVKGKAK